MIRRPEQRDPWSGYVAAACLVLLLVGGFLSALFETAAR